MKPWSFLQNPFIVMWIIGAVITILMVGVQLVRGLVLRRRHGNGFALGSRARRLQLASMTSFASSKLVEADDLIKTSEQEVRFAEGRFGAESVRQYRAALDEAKQRVHDAFDLLRKLLDDVADTEQERTTWYRQIMVLTKAAGDLIATEAQTFEKLRDVDHNAPELLGQVTDDAARLNSQIETADTTLTTLRARYAPSALSTVDDAVRQARGLLQLAADNAQRAQENPSTAKRGRAAIDIGDAQVALAQATTLLGSIDVMRDDLDAATASVRAEIEDLGSAIAHIEAAGVELLPDLAQRNAEAVRLAQDVIASAEAEGPTPPDPLATLDRLRDANRTIDEAVRSTTEETVRAAGVRRRIERDAATARGRIRACDDYISSHLGVVGANARSRLQQAEAELTRADALAATDPDAALDAIAAAIRYAGEAITDAGRDAADAERRRHRIDTLRVTNPSLAPNDPTHADSRDALFGGIVGGILAQSGTSLRGGFSSSRATGLRDGFDATGGTRPNDGGSGFRSSGSGFNSSGGGFRSSGGGFGASGSGFRSSGGGFSSSSSGRRR